MNGCFQEHDGWRDAPQRSYANRFFIYCNLARKVNLGYELSWKRVIASVMRKLGMSQRHSLGGA